mmetsp:Transcript_21599/g.30249  ORF Transcript_21599/g.30249 Transcript_21599/m.30249 type:complete len:511 (+) Transcript_21599:187-1719(+)|eukprot:CAMPEP_0184870966 /NCGR_PEP_ID=MMETSP0580-20130426/39389_1 /TAXON_ID=1118495 /ORGANISM="Dactyliosolen fragilissimus" /LENGTH=510 /DNA_ID=CAMNT_0027373373 /DNA_START=149 /DNA_END=1681 /DNA_ORIENTATION=+
MVLTARQRKELHSGIYEYLLAQEGEAFVQAAEALAIADPGCAKPIEKPNISSNRGNDVSDDVSVMSIATTKSSMTFSSTTTTRLPVPILEKKWTVVPRLQKKILELERAIAASSRGYSNRSIGGGQGLPLGGPGSSNHLERRLLPRPPCTHTLQGHSKTVTSLAIHPVYTVIVSGSEDGTIKVWDHECGEYLRTLKGHTEAVNSLSFSPTGSHLASSSSDLAIKLWDFSSYACLRTLTGHEHTISSVKFIPSPSDSITLPSNDANASDQKSSSAGESTSSSFSTGIDASKAGASFLVSASRDRSVKIWDVESGYCVKTITDHTDWVRCIAVRESDGQIMATSGHDQLIFLYNTTGDRNKITELRGHEHVVESLSFVTSTTPAETALSGSAANKKKTTSQLKHQEQINNYLASAGRDRTVRLWNIATSECIHVFREHDNWVKSTIIHPSGNYILSAGDDTTIRVMDIKNKRCLRTIQDAHTPFVNSLIMHHTLPILVSGGVDKAVKCWQLD